MSGNPVLLWIYATIERFLARRTDLIINISDNDFNRAREIGIDPKKMIRIYNGIPDRAALTKPLSLERTGPIKALFVGRLDVQKGIDILLNAVSNLAGRVHLTVVGAKVVSSKAQIDVVDDHVALLGWRTSSDIEALIDESDVVVVPSRWEGFGFVAIEAMRGARAVIASNVGGLREIVDPGVTGYLVDINKPGELTRVLGEIERPALLTMGQNGHQRFHELFRAGQMSGRIFSAYMSVSNQKRCEADR